MLGKLQGWLQGADTWEIQGGSVNKANQQIANTDENVMRVGFGISTIITFIHQAQTTF